MTPQVNAKVEVLEADLPHGEVWVPGVVSYVGVSHVIVEAGERGRFHVPLDETLERHLRYKGT